MTFDSSRFTFDAWRDFLGVVMQQGRVQLDSDWNELVVQFLRRMQAGSLDTMGPAIVPRETPEGFLISVVGGTLKIGVGRMYVDGLLAENHGGGAKTWDPRLTELKGGAVDYTAQPYYPEPLALPPAGSAYLVYLDVWQREVTYLQYPELVEKAVGIDTTGRLQTVWQVRILHQIGDGVTCSSVTSLERWKTLTQSSSARLSTSTGGVPGTPDPCQIPPSGGYKGLENQLYRVEIHQGDQPGPILAHGPTTFKWSRDNATVASRISHINPGYESIVVESIGRDEVLRFSDGDWIEITDDVRELQGYSGVMCRIRIGGGVDAATNTIVLTKPLPEGTFPSSEEPIDPSRNTRVRRWDHKGRILRADGTVYFDLDSPDSGGEVSEGVIPVPDQHTSLFLENGILVRFGSASEGGISHTGDYWNFAARTIDASIEILNEAPPLGIHHHYARLAIVTFPPAASLPIVSDCRVLWPPEFEAEGDCACDQCVKPGIDTLQKAIDTLAKTGGVICLAAGIYYLTNPLSITKIRSLRIRGKGWRTLLIASHDLTAVAQVKDSQNIVIENLAIIGAGLGNKPINLINVRNTSGLELDHLNLFAMPPDNIPGVPVSTTGVSLSGYILGFRMRECSVMAEVGIGSDVKQGMSFVSALAVTDNLFVCSRIGIGLSSEFFHHSETRIAHNRVFGTEQVGIQILGAALPGSSCLVEANVLHLLYPSGNAIVVGVDGLRIVGNEILGPDKDVEGSGVNGVVLEPGLDPRGIGHCWITGNRIANMHGSGIAIRTFVGSAMIKQNVIERTGCGIAFTDAGSAGHLSIENNHLLEIAADAESGRPVVAIQVLATLHTDITDNIVNGFAVNQTKARNGAAILVIGGGDIRIRGNHLSDLGPREKNTYYITSIELVIPFKSVSVEDNTIIRREGGTVQSSKWQAIRIVPPTAGSTQVHTDIMILPRGENAFFLLTGSRLFQVELTSDLDAPVTISGNKIVVQNSEMPIVQVEGDISILFSGNNCMAWAAESIWGSELATIMIKVARSSSAVIISQNQIRSSKLNSVIVSGPSPQDIPNFTVMGNITDGIKIGSDRLGEPWKQLNIIRG
ncbi:parallel beta helix pectate lyase-like protein [Nitrosospira sp. Nsp5]|uniref:Right handed beta helix region n=1 Tax=Nitrosospira multiformis TaxID=1231 RepID=A0ABY0TCM4_9PROT|nr:MULTISPECIES: DUF6519 domain-containing protein [Nitrosospira]PTR05774.1 parallel beta helix pectate lyase-like protein [Nitrosospira sp. Nsp5]SDQ62628.1 Right handed beta helix region [Nitrosospira multiformis]